ncbi:EAL domain-containing protein [Devosia sp. 1566]|uniref:putative bifunctional diguanylate cyclase/phosphodiesterase n=1 Tax=Devosia sp. 1566 TaxID=2499144 RepID=UPI0019CF959F|nr:EAL domain-containing protein [Devosia sp. 1566]
MATVSLCLALALVLAFAVAAWWAVHRIDTRELVEEQHYIAAGIAARKERIAMEQDSSAAGDDAVVNLRAANQTWIAQNLVEWMGTFFKHDRVYVIAPDNRVVRAANEGVTAEPEVDPRDLPTVEALTQLLRQEMAAVSAAMSDSTAAITGLGLSETARLTDGQLAFVSIRPVVPTSRAVTQTPGSEFLHVSVVLLGSGFLDQLGRQAGLTDLRIGGPGKGSGTLPLLSNAGRIVGFVVWTPIKPALALLKDSAPAALGLLLLGSAGMGGLLVWLRRTTLQLEQSQAQIEFLAFHDPLTGIANRALFEVRLQEALQYEYLAKAKVALVCIDLDKFKEINDTLGHAAGDQLIKQVARRLSATLPEGATLTRLGGDEFALVQPGVVSDGHARFLCQSMLDSFHDPFVLGGEAVNVTASLGVALEAGDAVSTAEMMRCADVALYAAKAAGRNCFRIYDLSMDQLRREKRILEVDLRNAILGGTELHLLYQPIYGALGGEIVGAEALVRWNHPVRGPLSPDSFIGDAEERGVIHELGLWVLAQACGFAAIAELPWIAVNVSPLQFDDPNLADRILDVLSNQHLQPDRLELEITEGILLKNSPMVRDTLAKLRTAGIRIALDDFGTGYSSISHLRHHSVDKLKIDQSITRDLLRDTATSTIVRSIIEMAHALGVSVTAEGVEDDLQLQRLRNLGCASFQGYLLSRPIPGDRLIEIVASSKQGNLLQNLR